MNRMLSHAALAAALLVLSAGVRAQALDTNGFVDWERMGDATVSAGVLRLSTASLAFEDDFPLAAGALNLSGTAAAEAGIAPASIETFAGIAAGALDADLLLQAYEGSAVRRSFSSAANMQLSFQWTLDTRDDTFPDLVFAVLDGQLLQPGTAADATLPASGPFSFTTGVRGFATPLIGAGPHTLVIGVVDIGDYNMTSTLSISQVLLQPVPEAPALPAMLAGAALLGGLLRRRGIAAPSR
jgi:hypothetical protein